MTDLLKRARAFDAAITAHITRVLSGQRTPLAARAAARVAVVVDYLDDAFVKEEAEEKEGGEEEAAMYVGEHALPSVPHFSMLPPER